jgi:hypothetical protein
MNKYSVLVSSAAGLLVLASGQAQFFTGSTTELEVIINFRNSVDDRNVGFDIGPTSAFSDPTAFFPLPGVTLGSLNAGFGGLFHPSDLRFSVAAYDLVSGLPAKSHLWMSTPESTPQPVTQGSGQNIIRSGMQTAINTYKNYGTPLGGNGMSLSQTEVSSTAWSGSYSDEMGADPGKWNGNSAFGTETITDSDFYQAGDRAALALWYLDGGSSGQQAQRLGTITLGYGEGGEFYATYTGMAVPEPSAAALGVLGGATLLFQRRRGGSRGC